MKNKLKGEINKALLVDSVFKKPATDNIIDLMHEYLYFYIHDNYRGF